MNKLSIKMVAFVALAFAAFPSVASYASKSDLVTITSEIQKKDPTFVLVLGKGDIVEIEGGFSDILVANPSIVDVSAIQNDKLYIVGLSLGDTNIVALDEFGNIVKRLNLHVRTDHLAIQEILDELFPDENIILKTVSNQLYVTGSVSNPSIASKIMNIVGHYVGDIQGSSSSNDSLAVNLLEVRGEQQVMLRVRIVEASRDIVKELGIETRANVLNALNDPADMGVSGDFGAWLGVNGGEGLTRDPFAVSNLVFDPGIEGLGLLDFVINLMDNDDYINVLAEPNLTAISGEEASFLAGGEFPVPAGRDSEGNIIIEFREFGVSLNFIPTVLSSDRISLQLKTEVSSLSYENALTLTGVQVPGLDIRRTSTTVEMASGGSLMIAGLLRSETAKGMTGIPGIKNTPIIGDLLKSDSFRRAETELIVIVTPYLVKPFKDTEQAVMVENKITSPLSVSFADNLKRNFGRKIPADLFENGLMDIGYILD